MGLPAIPPQPSALQSFLNDHETPRNSPHPPHLHHLALQIAHNLRYQHGWKDVRIHYNTSDSMTKELGDDEAHPLPRPLLSGLPPRRLYVHPDEQIEILQRQKQLQRESEESGETTVSGAGQGLGLEGKEREWVLPSHLREKWTLRRFGEVFNCIPAVPGSGEGEGEELFEAVEGEVEGGDGDGEGEGANEWRLKMPKRLLLATLDDDSTVVYYIVHDGIVKPRQN